MSLQEQFDRLDLAKYNWRVLLEYQENPPSSTDSFCDYISYLSTIRFCEVPVEVDYRYGWIGSTAAAGDNDYGWNYQDSNGKNPIDIFAVKKDHNYFILRGSDATSGTRFRVITVDEDIRQKSSGVVLASQILLKQDTPTEAWATLINGVSNSNRYHNPDYDDALTPFFRAENNGWLLIQKDNNYATGLSCFVFDLSTPLSLSESATN